MSPKIKLILLAVVTADFAAFTGYLIADEGLWPLFESALATGGGRQIAVDLCIALTLFAGWMWTDAKRRGRNPVGWIVLTVATGSFGPLLYLMSRELEALRADRPVTRPAGAVA